jgi:hypothetical protein
VTEGSRKFRTAVIKPVIKYHPVISGVFGAFTVRVLLE